MWPSHNRSAPLNMCDQYSLQGAIMPVAYAPNNRDASDPAPILDALITQEFGPGTVINFRLYPHSENYQSTLAANIAFVLNVHLYAGYFIRVSVDEANAQTILEYRPQGGLAWISAAGPTYQVAIPTDATCYITVVQNAGGCGRGEVYPVSAIGFKIADGTSYIEPLFPSSCILECEYALVAIISARERWVYYSGNTSANFSIPGNWAEAWQILRQCLVDWWTQDTYPAVYNSAVNAAEDKFFIRLLPGQIMPIALRSPVPASFGEGYYCGQWAVVVTTKIPCSTIVYFRCNGWDEDSTDADAWLEWTTPTDQDLCPGTVVSFTNLGSTTPRASKGTLVNGPAITLSDPFQDIVAITAYSSKTIGIFNTRTYPITGTYTCAYYGPLPYQLVPGVTIPSRLWPACPSIVSMAHCKRVCDWLQQQAIIANAYPVRWITQPLPSYILTCSKGCATGCAACCTPAIQSVKRCASGCGSGCSTHTRG